MQPKLTLAAVAAAVAILASPAAAQARPRCHWHTYRKGGTQYFVQVCSFPKPHHRKANKRWTTAGPENSPAPIGG